MNGQPNHGSSDESFATILNDLEEIFEKDAGIALLKGTTRKNRVGAGESVEDPVEDPVEKVRRQVLETLDKLDRVLSKSISNHSWKRVTIYLFIWSLGAVALASLVLSVMNQWPLVGATAALSPIPFFTWMFRELTLLEAQAAWYALFIGKYHPKIITCDNIICLQQISKEIAKSLDRLGRPMIVS